MSTKELGTWTGYFMGTSRSHSSYSFHYNHLYLIQACVPLPFVIAIGNLQFDKILCSVSCIDCKFYTCLNSSFSKNTNPFGFFDLDVVCACQQTANNPGKTVPWQDLPFSYSLNYSDNLSDSLDG